MKTIQLVSQFIKRMEDLEVGPDGAEQLALCLYDARANERPFVVIVVRCSEKYSYRAYEIRNDKARITIPPHPPYVSI